MHDEIKRYGADVLALGGAPRETAARVAHTLKLPFPVLADPERKTYADYGFSKVALVIQQSGTILVDRDGIVQYVHRATNPQQALRRHELRASLRSLDESRS